MGRTACLAALILLACATTGVRADTSPIRGYGRYSCTDIGADGSFSPNQSLCPGTMKCVASGNAFFCGVQGAKCYNDAACDGGSCNFADLTCVGGIGQRASTGDNPRCLGNLGRNFDFICGVSDSACANGYYDYGGTLPAMYNQNCASGYVCDEDSQCQRAAEPGDYCFTSRLICPADYPCTLLSRTDVRCLKTVAVGDVCTTPATTCGSGAFCSTVTGQCVAQVTTAGGSCATDPLQCTVTSSGQQLFCQAQTNGQGNTCRLVGTSEYASCAGDLSSGKACASPRYCTGPNAPAGSQYQCRTKALLGGSCAFDPVNGCIAGLYCTSTDQTCQAISAQAGQTCGIDSNACAASSDLYCVASTGLCAQKATTVGATCAFDVMNGCSTTASGQELYCRASDVTCQIRLTSVGADCRADPTSACGTATAADGTTTPLYCSMPSYLCAAKLGAGASCSSNPAQACASPYYCSSNNDVCISQVTKAGGSCNADPYAQCGLDPSGIFPGYNGQLYPLVQVDRNGNQFCLCAQSPGPTSITPVPGTFGLTTIGDDCSADPTFACGYSATGIKLYCALSTNTCQAHVTTVGQSCAYDYLGACGITTDGTLTQLYPSIPIGSSGHADCTCVTQADVVVRPSSRARARARSRRNLSLCPGSHTACPVGDGFECIDTENNIEQCGGCSENGAVDCTALGGVAAVGCVAGRCEIWACEDGYDYDSTAEACIGA